MIDADGDGKLDLIFVNGAALKVGMNAKDRADKSDSRYWNWLYRNRYLSAHDKSVHFGLGPERLVKLLEIRWPSGVVQSWKNVAANQIFVAKEALQ